MGERRRQVIRSLSGMGYLRGLRHGAIAGAVLGLLYAPESGVAIRRRVSRLLGQAQEMMAGDGGPGGAAQGVGGRGWGAGGSGGSDAAPGGRCNRKQGQAPVGRTRMDQTVEKTIDR